MKKSLLALAILGAFAGIASAQTNITIYGVADVAIERFKTDPGASQTNMSSGVQSGSRLGFRGTEDLGGGLSASFNLENGYDISTGAAAQGGLLFGRQAWVGLNGGFGSVKLGRQYTPMFLALDAVDPFNTALTGGASGVTTVFRPYGYRMNNTINYSASFGDLKGQVAYGLGEVAGSSSIGRQIGASVGYNSGPITGVFAYHNQNTATAAGVDTGNARTFMLGGAFNFGVATLHAAYADNRDEGATGLLTGRSRDYMLGASASFGAGRLLASYVRRDDRFAAGANDADYYQIGYSHSLSKRTNLYTSYSIVKNDGVAQFNAPAAGDVSWLNAGIRHRF